MHAHTPVTSTLALFKQLLTQIESGEITDDKLRAFLETKGMTHRDYVLDQQRSARKIMGKNFLGIEEANKNFGIAFTEKEIEKIIKIPFSDNVLRKNQNTHILVAMPSISIIELMEKAGNTLFCDREGVDVTQYSFLRKRGKIGWHLVLKTPIPGSTGEMWRVQQALLGRDERTPSTLVMAYALIMYYLSTGEQLLEREAVRCSDVLPNGQNVDVCFAKKRVCISFHPDAKFSNLGIALEVA